MNAIASTASDLVVKKAAIDVQAGYGATAAALCGHSSSVTVQVLSGL